MEPTTKHAHDNDSDDVWAEDDEDNIEQHDNDTSKKLAYNDIVRQHRKQGYVDGITAHREDQLQRGFDDAFPQGAKLGIEVGKILARLKCKSGAPKREKEKEVNSGGVVDDEKLKCAINELSISKVLDRQYFDEDLQPLQTHDLIEKWRHQG
ncbi:YAE1 [Candida theae]|uniref:Protein YAE1 n=1 Tax=Candida theae TaxID=1198502 RepID=A0AAD5BCX2_9ASCO|nr:YAE1 [Candida theae]KAI5956022.1 YAE1 [Candida theae]